MVWQNTKPAASADLESAPVRGNFQELEMAYLGNLVPDPYHLIWAGGDAVAPTGTVLEGTGAAVARISTAGNHRAGGMACQLTLGSANGIIRRNLLSSIPPDLASKDISVSVDIKTATASLADVRLDDGIGVSRPAGNIFHTGGGGWERLGVTRTLDASATKLDLLYQVDIGAGSGNAIFDLPTMVVGGIIPQRFIPPKINEGVLYLPVVGDVAVKVGQSRFNPGLPMIVRNVSLRAETAPTGSALIVDVNHWDSAAMQSMFSTRPQIAATDKRGGANPDGTYRYRCFDGSKDDESDTDTLLGVDIDAVGSTLPGSDLEIMIRVLQFAEPLRAMEAF